MITINCGECDKQFEFTKKNVQKHTDDEGILIISLNCPRCSECEEVRL